MLNKRYNIFKVRDKIKDKKNIKFNAVYVFNRIRICIFLLLNLFLLPTILKDEIPYDKRNIYVYKRDPNKAEGSLTSNLCQNKG